MRVSGIGRVIFWNGGSLWIGQAGEAVTRHEHHAIQVAIGFTGPTEFRAGPDDPWTSYPTGVLIRPGEPHEFRAPGRRIANLLFEPETPLGRAMLERHPAGAIVGLNAEAGRLAAAFDDGAPDEMLVAESLSLLHRLAGTDRPLRPTDPRIARAMAWIAGNIDRAITLGELADHVGLSEGRLRHLFVAEAGIAFRPYVLWTRLNRALELGFGGASWTEAAHATNFADSAHLTRTCRRMYGLFPTSLRIDATAQDSRRIA